MLPDGFDFIASNPPYIETSELPFLQREVQKEPKTALDGGADGLIFYRAICDIWAKKLHPNGVLAVEIGETQGQAVKVLFRGLDRISRFFKGGFGRLSGKTGFDFYELVLQVHRETP